MVKFPSILLSQFKLDASPISFRTHELPTIEFAYFAKSCYTVCVVYEYKLYSRYEYNYLLFLKICICSVTIADVLSIGDGKQ